MGELANGRSERERVQLELVISGALYAMLRECEQVMAQTLRGTNLKRAADDLVHCNQLLGSSSSFHSIDHLIYLCSAFESRF